jgi:hypothetical protein
MLGEMPEKWKKKTVSPYLYIRKVKNKGGNP